MSTKGPFLINFASALTGAGVTGLLLKYGSESDRSSKRNCNKGFTDTGRLVCKAEPVQTSKLKK